MTDADTAELAPDPEAEPTDANPSASAEPPMGEDELRAALEAVTAERDSYLDTAQRIQAEFDNYRKRTSGAVDERIKGGLGRLAEALLPVLDSCDAAVAQGDDSADALRGQLLAVLAPHGLERVVAIDEPFDPTVHEAVLHETGDEGDPIVVEELRPGYLWNGKVLRAAMVKVRN